MSAAPFAIAVQSSAIDNIGDITPSMANALRMAVNSTASGSIPLASRAMREQVAFPASYISGADGRLSVTKKANDNDLEAIVTGRHRPTSLARFARGGRVGGRRGVRVEVNPGGARFLPRAFFINLRSGNDDTLGNLGIAIRLPVGQVPNRAYKPKLVGKNLWLLYGPSVDQVFDDVAAQIAPQRAQFLEDEFFRLLGIAA